MPPRGVKKGTKRARTASGASTKERGLYNQAKRLNIKGRSRMNKRQLLAAVNRKK